MRKISPKQRVINECLRLYKQKFIKKYGNKCMLCRRYQTQLPFPLSIFHIKKRSTHRRIILNELNLLLACWGPEKYYYIKSPWCHNIWEKGDRTDPRWQRIERRIKQLRGQDCFEKLDYLNVIEPKLTLLQARLYQECLKDEIHKL